MKLQLASLAFVIMALLLEVPTLYLPLCWTKLNDEQQKVFDLKRRFCKFGRKNLGRLAAKEQTTDTLNMSQLATMRFLSHKFSHKEAAKLATR
jgi:hypothetical protein